MSPNTHPHKIKHFIHINKRTTNRQSDFSKIWYSNPLGERNYFPYLLSNDVCESWGLGVRGGGKLTARSRAISRATDRPLCLIITLALPLAAPTTLKTNNTTRRMATNNRSENTGMSKSELSTMTRKDVFEALISKAIAEGFNTLILLRLEITNTDHFTKIKRSIYLIE